MPESENTFVLAVETSGRVGSVAIGQGDTILYESTFSGFMKHSAELFDSLDNLLTKTGIRPNQIGHLYITAGPGSFTGIRIAVTLAKMTAYAIGTRIVAIDTLDALAENAAEHLKIIPSDFTRIATILDAKQSRFFVSIYEQENGLWKKHLATSLLHPEELITLINKDNILTGLLGEGTDLLRRQLRIPLTCLLTRLCGRLLPAAYIQSAAEWPSKADLPTPLFSSPITFENPMPLKSGNKRMFPNSPCI